MQAVVVHAPMDYGLERVPVPPVPAGGLLLKVVACALCGSDLRTLRSGHRRVTLPWIIGHEICGVVAATGTSYRGPWQPGELLAVAPIVFCGACRFCRSGRLELCIDYREIAQAWPGGFAEYLAIPEESILRGAIQALPPDTDPALAAITEPISSCLNSQEKAHIGMGDAVVVMGAGAVGCIHAALARIQGAEKVIFVNRSAGRLRFAREFGPDGLIDASQTDPVKAVRELTDGYGPDVVILANASPEAVVQGVEMVGKGGRVLVFGGLPRDDCKPPVDMNLVHYNAIHLIGTTALAPRHQMLAVELVSSGRLPARSLITHRLPLASFDQGVKLAFDGEALKCVFFPGGVVNGR
jgi:L-iditol 2-dehydrogenase